MADRLLVDLDADGRVRVGPWLEGELPQPGEPRELTWPLDGDALEELRWYLEDYLIAPFGVYEDHGAKVAAEISNWGKAVFNSVFGEGPARDAYQRALARQRPLELVFRSASPALLGLPWELMTDPGQPKSPLALQLAGVSRSLLTADGAAETVPVPEGRLRVLMVISRPRATEDVGYRMIARPLLERLEAVRGKVELMVLRPPTLDALRQTLAGANADGNPFHIVHFDGHGAMPGRRVPGGRAPLSFADATDEAILSFEKPNGGAAHVLASRVAQVLAQAKVPVVVLNACQSGAVGKDLEAAVATSLLKAGVAAVVGMAYSVYAVAAAEFMAAFYERLFAGETVSAAVAAGRSRMYLQNKRPSPKGELPLADWLVPVHYLRRDVSFPQARTERSSQLPALEQLLDIKREADGVTGTGDLDPVGPFVGRDDLFYELEVAARLQKVVVLHGPGGTGKTELAKAFGRWWRDTCGVEQPGWVFWHSFEPGVASFGLDGVITEIGMRMIGTGFARLEAARRRSVVRDLLAERRTLLIWDNFETVRSMPDPAGAARPLDQAGRAELTEFLNYLAIRGGSAVLITSRTTEDWLGDIRRITVGGLAGHEATEYADSLLAPYPAAVPHRARRSFGGLMEWLDGHPLSMRLILPRLATVEPEALLAGLRGVAPLPGGDTGDDGRTTSLAASVSYSFAHLADATRRVLPAVCLFQGVADAAVLEAFSQIPGVPERFQGVGREDWLAALEDGARVGLLANLEPGLYQIHPALPAYLAGWWRQEEPANHDTVRDAAATALVAAHAEHCEWLLRQVKSGDAARAFTITGLERRTLNSQLRYAFDHALWPEAQRIGRLLNEYWDAQGLEEEARSWVDRVWLLAAGPDGAPPSLDSPVGALWLVFIGGQAMRELRKGQLDDAERAYRQILTALEASSPSAERQHRVCVACHQLGWVAGERGRMDEAEQW